MSDLREDLFDAFTDAFWDSAGDLTGPNSAHLTVMEFGATATKDSEHVDFKVKVLRNPKTHRKPYCIVVRATSHGMDKGYCSLDATDLKAALADLGERFAKFNPKTHVIQTVTHGWNH